MRWRYRRFCIATARWGRWKEGRVVYDTAKILFTDVLAVTGVMDGARRLIDEEPGLVARDALHAAVVRSTGWR